MYKMSSEHRSRPRDQGSARSRAQSAIFREAQSRSRWRESVASQQRREARTSSQLKTCNGQTSVGARIVCVRALETWPSPRESRALDVGVWCLRILGAECTVRLPPQWRYAFEPACATAVVQWVRGMCYVVLLGGGPVSRCLCVGPDSNICSPASSPAPRSGAPLPTTAPSL